MRHDFLGLDAEDWESAGGELPHSPMLADERLTIGVLNASIAAMLRRLDAEEGRA